MKRTPRRLASLLVLVMLAGASPALAQGGHEAGHAVAERAALSAEQSEPGVITLRLGPVELPARSHHGTVAQAPDRFWQVPFDGWILSYTPSLASGDGGPVPGHLLHHVAFYHTGRSDFLCPEKEEHIFGAGGEMNQWIELPGFGYRVAAGDRIRVNTMFHNPTPDDHPQTYLEVRVAYQPESEHSESEHSESEAAPRRAVYPTWFDVQECGDSSYELQPGTNVTTGRMEVPVSGRLLGVGGHLHTYGKELVLSDVTEPVAPAESDYREAAERADAPAPGAAREIARLEPATDEAGRILSMPIVPFLLQGGYGLEAGDVLEVTARYRNPTGRRLPGGAMGIVVGYFLPDDPAVMERYARDDERP